MAPCENGVIDSNYEIAMIHYIQINYVELKDLWPLHHERKVWYILIKFLLDVVLPNPYIYLNLYLELQF